MLEVISNQPSEEQNPKDRFGRQPRTYRLLNEPKVEEVRGSYALCVFDSGFRVSDLRLLTLIELRLNAPRGSAEASRAAIRLMPLRLGGLRGHVAVFRRSKCWRRWYLSQPLTARSQNSTAGSVV